MTICCSQTNDSDALHYWNWSILVRMSWNQDYTFTPELWIPREIPGKLWLTFSHQRCNSLSVWTWSETPKSEQWCLVRLFLFFDSEQKMHEIAG